MKTSPYRAWSALLLLAAAAGSPAPAQEDFALSTINTAYERLSPSLCTVLFTQEITDPRTGETRRRDGSSLGLVVRPDGLVVTHGHLILDSAEPVEVRVRLGQGSSAKEYPAQVLQKPDDINLAFLRVQSDTPLDLPVVRFSKASLVLGEPVAVFGLSGETLDLEPGVLVARVSAILEEPRKTYALDGNIRFGYVTGPVMNTRGEIVGVVGFDLGRAEGGELHTRSGHPLVYQTELFEGHIAEPPSVDVSPGAREDAWLGVFTQPLKTDYAEYWKLEDTGGLLVSTVLPDSPALSAGIQSGDIIKSFDGKPTQARQDRDVLAFTQLVRDTGVGRTVTVELLRAGQPLSVEVTLSQLPATAQEAGEYDDAVLGLAVREITRDVRILLNLAEDVQGVIVRRVRPGSPAQAAKIRPGIVILSVADQPTTTLAEYEEAIEKLRKQKPSEVSVFARAGAQTGFFRVQPRY